MSGFCFFFWIGTKTFSTFFKLCDANGLGYYQNLGEINTHNLWSFAQSTQNSPLSSPLYDMLLIAKPYIKQLFVKLTDVHFRHHFVDLFYTVLKTIFSGSGYATKGLLLDVSHELVNFNQQVKGIEQRTGVALETIEKHSKKQLPSNSKKKQTLSRQKRQICWKAFLSLIRVSI